MQAIYRRNKNPPSSTVESCRGKLLTLMKRGAVKLIFGDRLVELLHRWLVTLRKPAPEPGPT